MSHVNCLTLGAYLAALIGAGCSSPPEPNGKETTSSTIILSMPTSLGHADKPPVPFNHARHTEALGEDDCTSCHEVTKDNALNPSVFKNTSKAEWTTQGHVLCMTCHQQGLSKGQRSGPVTCGGCHPNTVPAQPDMKLDTPMDYVLHQKHTALVTECATCHHVEDEGTKKLQYRKGEEHACGSCHEPETGSRAPSLKQASHRSCVSCHHQKARSGQKGGPLACTGCHEPRDKGKLEGAVSLDNERPSFTWIAADGATTRAVGFDHASHEPRAPFCTTCHHEKLGSCSSCHKVTAEMGAVGLEHAFHHPESMRSCVGCHEQTTRKETCAGCHHMLSSAPSQGSCTVCHNGPAPGTPVDGAARPERASASPLPAIGPDFPEKVVMNLLTDEFSGSELPHATIVARLLAGMETSKLAAEFHGSAETLCTACHHHSPPGDRPPACKSCHGKEASATHDKPGLKAAYHRQCIGCHEQMHLKTDCTICHERAKETRP